MSDERNWELFTGNNEKRSYVACLNADLGRLSVGVRMVRAGFNQGQRYDLLFDREALMIGLRRSDSGFKVSRVGHRGTSCAIACLAFCRHFGLSGRYEAERFELDGGLWVLPLTVVERST